MLSQCTLFFCNALMTLDWSVNSVNPHSFTFYSAGFLSFCENGSLYHSPQKEQQDDAFQFLELVHVAGTPGPHYAVKATFKVSKFPFCSAFRLNINCTVDTRCPCLCQSRENQIKIWIILETFSLTLMKIRFLRLNLSCKNFALQP